MLVNVIFKTFYMDVDLLFPQYRYQDLGRLKEAKQQKKKQHEPWEQEEGLATGRGAALVKAAEHLRVVHG